jgi:hypothetical protein
MDEYLNRLQAAFDAQKQKAIAYVEKFNAALPLQCPWCQSPHLPGLPCPEPSCGYMHPVSFMLVVQGEWGPEIRPLNDQRRVLRRFDVEGVQAENASSSFNPSETVLPEFALKKRTDTCMGRKKRHSRSEDVFWVHAESGLVPQETGARRHFVPAHSSLVRRTARSSLRLFDRSNCHCNPTRKTIDS